MGQFGSPLLIPAWYCPEHYAMETSKRKREKEPGDTCSKRPRVEEAEVRKEA